MGELSEKWLSKPQGQISVTQCRDGARSNTLRLLDVLASRSRTRKGRTVGVHDTAHVEQNMHAAQLGTPTTGL
jgi:hypothetical protein